MRGCATSNSDNNKKSLKIGQSTVDNTNNNDNDLVLGTFAIIQHFNIAS